MTISEFLSTAQVGVLGLLFGYAMVWMIFYDLDRPTAAKVHWSIRAVFLIKSSWIPEDNVSNSGTRSVYVILGISIAAIALRALTSDTESGMKLSESLVALGFVLLGSAACVETALWSIRRNVMKT
jgi:hypothetical protein